MDHSEQRDAAEERYNREFCIPCGASPCEWNGEPDGFHTGKPAPETGLPCRTCRGAPFFERETGAVCPSCGGTGHGSALRLPCGYLAEITPGLAGWSWTLLNHGTPVDGGVRATQEEASDAAKRRWAAAEPDWLAGQLAAAILMAAAARFGPTTTAADAAYAAVAVSAAFEEERRS